MQFAIDENGIRTSINNSIKGKPYKCPSKKGFIRVLATYGKCKTIVGKVYTEKEFEKYITSL